MQEEQKRRLYKIFGENARGTQEERDKEIAEYQRQLVEEEFGESRNKLRDYQAEGVAWLMSNYVNNRSSVLADEVSSFLSCDIRLLLLPERFPLSTTLCNFSLSSNASVDSIRLFLFLDVDGLRQNRTSCFVSQQARQGVPYPRPIPSCSPLEHPRALASGVCRMD